VGVDTASSGLTSKNSADDGRVSLVFKRAMHRGNGKKGHGKAGEGGYSWRL